MCLGAISDDLGTGIGLENGEEEGNIIYSGTLVFFHNIFNISAVASTRWICLGEVLILYFYISIYGLNWATRVTLHILNLIRLRLGYERYRTMNGPDYKYKIVDYLTFVPAKRKFVKIILYL